MIRPLLIGALIALTAALTACGDGDETPLLQASTSEVRATVRVNNQADLVVALEARGSEGLWGATTHPTDATVAEQEDGDDWWRSSAITVEVQQAVTIRVEDRAFVIEPPIDGFTDECGSMFATLSTDAERLAINVVTGEACDQWSPPFNLTAPAELVHLTARIAARWSGDCVNLRIEVRDNSSDWRPTPASYICGLEERLRAAAADGEGFVPQPAAPVSLPVSRRGGAIELRMGGPLGISAAVDGRILLINCGLQLQRGSQSVWQHRYEGAACDWTHLDRVLELNDVPAPPDLLDKQQYAVGDWEYEVAANLLTAAWRRPITFDSAQAIVNAVYTDFYGSADGAPQVTIAPNEQAYTGQYDPSLHEIQLTSAGFRAYLVFHETAHAMLRLSVGAANAYYLEARHGPLFAALLITLWTRYADGFDPEAARALAAAYKVQLDELVPIAPTGDEQTRQAVIDALGINDPDRQTE